jgi:hypothetical protein
MLNVLEESPARRKHRGDMSMAEEIGKAGHVTTSDGVRLHYVEAGVGKPVILIPGQSQTAAQFKYQLAGLHDRYRLAAIIKVHEDHMRTEAFSGYSI